MNTATDPTALLILDPADEGMHTPGPQAQWSESMFFHLPENNGERATLLRMGRRVNEGYAEVTVMHHLPDGGAAIGFQRAPILDNLAMSAGGLEFTPVVPLKKWRCTFRGPVRRLVNARDLENPKAALSSAPELKLDLAFEFDDLVPCHAASPNREYMSGVVADGHYRTVCEARGTMALGEERRSVEGFGFRDHSWGERNWHAINYWRWVWGQFDRENVFSVIALDTDAAGAEDTRHVSGVVLRNGRKHFVDKVTIDSSYGPAPHRYFEGADIRIPLGDGDLTATIRDCKPVPLRHVKDEEVFRIVENLSRVEMDGKSGVGWVEAADRIVSGVPYGNARD